MSGVHVDELLSDHVRGELTDAERTQVETHLVECAACRSARERIAHLMSELARTAPVPPPVHWGAYRAELRERIERRGSRPGALWSWLVRPAPALVAAGLVAALVYVGLPGTAGGFCDCANAGAEEAAKKMEKSKWKMARWRCVIVAPQGQESSCVLTP